MDKVGEEAGAGRLRGPTFVKMGRGFQIGRWRASGGLMTPARALAGLSGRTTPPNLDNHCSRLTPTLFYLFSRPCISLYGRPCFLLISALTALPIRTTTFV